MAGLAYPETLATAFSNAAALQYDPDPRGLRSARQAVANWHESIEIQPIAHEATRARTAIFTVRMHILPGPRACP